MLKKSILIFFFLACAIPQIAWAKLKVVSTIPMLGAVAQAVGGDKVEVQSLARANQDPHFLQAKPSYVSLLHRADLLVQVGLSLEIGWLPVAITQSRNPKIQLNAPGHVDASQGIQRLEVPTGKLDRSAGDVHPQGNPHYFLDPRSALIVAKNISEGLIRVDPEGEAQYRKNLESFQSSLMQHLKKWEKSLQSIRGKRVISYHKTWAYFSDWSGLIVEDEIEPLPGIPPSSKHVDQLIKLISAKKIQGIFMSSFYPHKVPHYLETKAHIPLILTALGPEELNEGAYFDFFSNVLNLLEQKLK